MVPAADAVDAAAAAAQPPMQPPRVVIDGDAYPSEAVVNAHTDKLGPSRSLSDDREADAVAVWRRELQRKR